MTDLADLPEAQRLAASYASGPDRAAVIAFFRLDNHLRKVALPAREPILTQVKLAWWREAIGNVNQTTPQGTPILSDLPPQLIALTKELRGLVDGWEAVAVGDNIVDGAATLSSARTAALSSAIVPAEGLAAAVANWTHHELANIGEDSDVRARLIQRVRECSNMRRLPRRLRPITVLDGLARRAARGGRPWLLGDRLSPLIAIRLGIFGR